MNNRISLLLADDHELVRATLCDRLNREPDLTVVASVPDADQALERAAELQPRVIVMDIDMPGRLCFDAARTLRARCPGTRIIFLSAYYNDRFIDEALAVKAAGYVTKAEPPEALIAAVRAAVSGKTYYSPEIQARIVIDTHGTRLAGQARSRVQTLTPRELEVLRHVATGKSQGEMAQIMCVSPKTVNYHCASLMKKLDIHDRVELARFAIREGLITA